MALGVLCCFLLKCRINFQFKIVLAVTLKEMSKGLRKKLTFSWASTGCQKNDKKAPTLELLKFHLY